MMKSILFCILLAGQAFFLTAYSMGASSPLLLGFVGIAALLGTPLAAIWFHGIWHERLLKAGKLVFPITFTIYLLGYYWTTLITLL